MNKIVNGVANDYEFPNLYNPNISYSKAYTEQLLSEKDKEIERLNNIINELEKHLLEYLEEWQDIEDDFVKGRCLMARDVTHDIYELKEGK